MNFQKRQKEKKRNVNIYLGFRNKEYVVLEKEFKDVANKLIITTDDGSYGIKGFAINELEKDLNNIECIYACRTASNAKSSKKIIN